MGFIGSKKVLEKRFTISRTRTPDFLIANVLGNFDKICFWAKIFCGFGDYLGTRD